jgi:hypothetical protein
MYLEVTFKLWSRPMTFVNALRDVELSFEIGGCLQKHILLQFCRG